MGTSSSRDRTADHQLSFTAEASVFSGRPDPTWAIGVDVSARLERIWTSLPPDERGASASLPPPLGYRGVFVFSPDGRRWTAYRQSISLEAGDHIEHRFDEQQVFESAVLGTAPEGLLPPWAGK